MDRKAAIFEELKDILSTLIKLGTFHFEKISFNILADLVYKEQDMEKLFYIPFIEEFLDEIRKTKPEFQHAEYKTEKNIDLQRFIDKDPQLVKSLRHKENFEEFKNKLLEHVKNPEAYKKWFSNTKFNSNGPSNLYKGLKSQLSKYPNKDQDDIYQNGMLQLYGSKEKRKIPIVIENFISHTKDNESVLEGYIVTSFKNAVSNYIRKETDIPESMKVPLTDEEGKTKELEDPKSLRDLEHLDHLNDEKIEEIIKGYEHHIHKYITEYPIKDKLVHKYIDDAIKGEDITSNEYMIMIIRHLLQRHKEYKDGMFANFLKSVKEEILNAADHYNLSKLYNILEKKNIVVEGDTLEGWNKLTKDMGLDMKKDMSKEQEDKIKKMITTNKSSAYKLATLYNLFKNQNINIPAAATVAGSEDLLRALGRLIPLEKGAEAQNVEDAEKLLGYYKEYNDPSINKVINDRELDLDEKFKKLSTIPLIIRLYAVIKGKGSSAVYLKQADKLFTHVIDRILKDGKAEFAQKLIDSLDETPTTKVSSYLDILFNRLKTIG